MDFIANHYKNSSEKKVEFKLIVICCIYVFISNSYRN